MIEHFYYWRILWYWHCSYIRTKKKCDGFIRDSVNCTGLLGQDSEGAENLECLIFQQDLETPGSYIFFKLECHIRICICCRGWRGIVVINCFGFTLHYGESPRNLLDFLLQLAPTISLQYGAMFSSPAMCKQRHQWLIFWSHSLFVILRVTIFFAGEQCIFLFHLRFKVLFYFFSVTKFIV